MIVTVLISQTSFDMHGVCQLLPTFIADHARTRLPLIVVSVIIPTRIDLLVVGAIVALSPIHLDGAIDVLVEAPRHLPCPTSIGAENEAQIEVSSHHFNLCNLIPMIHDSQMRVHVRVVAPHRS